MDFEQNLGLTVLIPHVMPGHFKSILTYLLVPPDFLDKIFLYCNAVHTKTAHT